MSLELGAVRLTEGTAIGAAGCIKLSQRDDPSDDDPDNELADGADECGEYDSDDRESF